MDSMDVGSSGRRFSFLNFTNTNTSANASGECYGNIDTLGVFEQWMFVGASVLIIIIHMFLVRRRFDGKRFGVAQPIDFLLLADRKRRLMYCLAFGASTGGVFNLITGTEILITNDFFLEILYKILSFSIVALLYYPIFLAIGTAASLIGSGIGLLYTTSLFVCKVLFLAKCSENQRGYLLLFGLGNLPGILCLFSIVLWLGYKLFREFWMGLRAGPKFRIEPSDHQPILDEDEKLWQVTYVRHLFNPQLPSPVTGLWKRVAKKVNDADHAFQYSLRCVIPFFVSALLLYWVTLYMILFFYDWYTFLQELTISRWILSCFLAAACLASLISATQIYFIAVHLRKDLLDMFKGKHRQQRKKIDLKSITFKSFHQNNFTQYAGYQTAMVIMGFAYQTILFTIMAAAVSFFFLYGALFGSDKALSLFFSFITPLAVGLVILIAAHVIVHFAFLEKGGKESLIITNRRVYNNFAYFTFFWNMMIGLIFAILRLIISFLISSVMVSRLNRTVMMNGAERVDLGYQIYLGFLRMENELTNPCLVVFARLLIGVGQDKAERASRGPVSSIAAASGPFTGKSYGAVPVETALNNALPTDYRVSRLAKNRWLVAVTMIRNPSTVAMRRGGQGLDFASGRKDEKPRGVEVEVTVVNNPVINQLAEDDFYADNTALLNA